MPRQKGVDPRHDRVAIAARRTEDEFRAPAVVREQRHRRELPCALVVAAIQQPTGQRVVTIGKAVGLDVHRLAGDTLDRKPAAVDGGRDVFDNDPDAAIRGQR